MDDRAGDNSSETRSDESVRSTSSDESVRSTSSDESVRSTSSGESVYETTPTDTVGGESIAREPATAVRAVQAAAIEHAFAVGPPAPGLRLAGQLAVLEDSDPDLAVLAPLVAALVGTDSTDASLRPGRRPPGPSRLDSRDGEHDPDPLVRGAAIAVARHDVPLARAADAADRPPDRIARAARVRRVPDDHTSL